MVQWVNRSLVQAPRNGTTSHTVAFTPATAGNLLVCIAEGAVTSTTPSGWTLPAAGSAINNTGLYVWYKTATAGESSLTTTHNGSNYPVAFLVYEFPAGSTFVKSASGTGMATAAANPNLTGLTGTNLLFGAAAIGNPFTNAAVSATWSGTGSPVADADVLVQQSATDGYWLGVAYVESSTATSFQPTAAVSGSSLSKEGLTFAVNVAAGGPAPKAGASAGTVKFTTAATGQRSPRSTASGAAKFTVAASGAATRRGSAAASAGFAATAAGTKPAKGSASAPATFTVAAAGAKPAVDGKSGSATASIRLNATAAGQRSPKGSAAGTAKFTVAASGLAPAVGMNYGSAATAVHLTATAVGSSPHKGAAGATLRLTPAAAGSAPMSGLAAVLVAFAPAASGTNARAGDVTVTATLAPRRWAATLNDRRWDGTLE